MAQAMISTTGFDPPTAMEVSLAERPERVVMTVTTPRPDGQTVSLRRRPGSLRPGWPVGDLVLRLLPTRTVYQPGEALGLRAMLVNTGQRDLAVLGRASHVELALVTRDRLGRPLASLDPMVPPPRPASTELRLLPPGGFLELRGWELLAAVNRRVCAGQVRLGSFRVCAVYRTDTGITGDLRALDGRAWADAVASNELLLTVQRAPAWSAPPDEDDGAQLKGRWP